MECKKLKLSFFTLLCVAVLGLASCAGYHFVSQENPFAHYDISSISIPVAYNFTTHPHIGPIMTQEVAQVLRKYRKLSVFASDQSADAVLIVIVDGPLKRQESLSASREEVIATSGGKNKRQMTIPLDNITHLNVRFVLLKGPSKREVEFLATNMGEAALPDGKKVIFNKKVAASSTFRTSLGSGESLSGDVNHTNWQENYRRSYLDLAKNIATQFEQTIVRAF